MRVANAGKNKDRKKSPNVSFTFQALSWAQAPQKWKATSVRNLLIPIEWNKSTD